MFLNRGKDARGDGVQPRDGRFFSKVDAEQAVDVALRFFIKMKGLLLEAARNDGVPLAADQLTGAVDAGFDLRDRQPREIAEIVDHRIAEMVIVPAPHQAEQLVPDMRHIGLFLFLGIGRTDELRGAPSDEVHVPIDGSVTTHGHVDVAFRK